MRRLFLSALVAAAASTAAPAAHADACVSVSTAGTLPPGTHLQRCAPFPGPSFCGEETAGVSPDALVTVGFCVPIV